MLKHEKGVRTERSPSLGNEQAEKHKKEKGIQYTWNILYVYLRMLQKPKQSGKGANGGILCLPALKGNVDIVKKYVNSSIKLCTLQYGISILLVNSTYQVIFTKSSITCYIFPFVYIYLSFATRRLRPCEQMFESGTR